MGINREFKILRRERGRRRDTKKAFNTVGNIKCVFSFNMHIIKIPDVHDGVSEGKNPVQTKIYCFYFLSFTLSTARGIYCFHVIDLQRTPH